jgi:hypothetical protein
MTTIARDLAVLDPDGRPAPLADLAAEHPVVLVLLRHFG